MEFDKDGCKVNNAHGIAVVEARREKNLYLLNVNVRKENANVAKSSNEGVTLWHQRLGHLNMASLTKLEKMLDGMNLKEVPLHHVCEACIEGKQQKTYFPKDKMTRASELLELVHSNVCRPMKTTSRGGARYFVAFIDNFSKKIHVYLLKAKGEVFDKFNAYKALVDNQIGMKIKTLGSNNGGEFLSKKFDNFLDECGIQRQTSAPYTPQQNGVVERANRTIMECTRSMIRAQGLDLEFWVEAVNTAVYIKNRCPTKALESKTPQKAWTSRKPNVSHLRVFGCKAFAHIPDEKKSKLESKSMPCVFLGYYEGTKAYGFMWVETKRIIKSRDVVFLEGTKEVENVHDNRFPSKEGKYVVVDEVMDDDENVKDANPISLKKKPTEDVEGDESMSNSFLEEDFATTQNEGLNEPQQDGRRERPQRQCKAWPRDWWVATKKVEQATIAFSEEPQTMQEMLNGKDAKKWEMAMQEEYDSLVVNNTWSLVPLPKGRKLISCKQVFKIKHGVDGEVERYKARLVARGFTQTFGVDYNETFAHVTKFVSIRCILALATIEDMEIHQMDVKTTFLNGDLEEDIYMEQPEGFTQESEHLVCKLHKSLYGLKQSPKAWNQKLDVFLKNIEFVRNDADFCVYVTQVGDVKFFIIVYVDDFILMCNNKDKLLQVKEEFSRKFEVKDLGNLHFFLDMEMERDRAQRLLYINQIGYLKEIFKRFCMEDCKAIRVPLDPKTKLKKNVNKDEEMVKVPYQQTVGSLMYAMLCTRPDLAYPISVHGESTHGQSKPKTSDCNQTQFSILARYFAFQIMLPRVITPRFGRIL